MIVELNPAKWFGRTPAVAEAAQVETIAAGAVETKTMKFISVMEAIGKDFAKGLMWAVKYAVPVTSLVALLFPAAAPAAVGVSTAVGLVQNAVMAIEQKYAASGAAKGTGTQKSAEVLTLVGPAVTDLLAKEGITVDAAYIQNVISAVVAILNVQNAPQAATA